MPRSAPCPSCGYELQGLLAQWRITCPECGSVCTLRHIADARARVPRSWAICIFLVPIVSFAFGIAAYLILSALPQWQSSGTYLAGFGGGFVWTLVAERRVEILPSNPGDSLMQRAAVWLCAALMAAVITFIMGFPALIVGSIVLR